jgi:hypothetical protein
VLVGAGVAVLAAAATTAAALGLGPSDSPPSANVGLPPATGTVTRTTLTETERVSGTLGYGTASIVSARGGLGGSGGPGGGSGSSTGTLTWLPAAGATVARGKPVFRVNELPVPLIYGTVPLYRVLRSGLSGPDVKQFEQNLAALGYRGFTVDDEFTSATASAVREWQADLGRDETGTVDADEVVVAPGPIRVGELKAAAGDTASGPVLTYTGTTRVVDIDLDVSLQHLVRKGVAATVTLPDNTSVEGTVDSVGTVATTSGGTGGGTGGGGGGSSTTVAVVVAIADQKALGTLDAAPVTVTLLANRHENVLTVPVAALVALAEGGYGVQVVDGKSAYYVAVQTGMFANGRVEVTGEGITEGTVVGMPK